MFESIILIGPGTDLYPLINTHLQITKLPILNKPLLEYNIEFLLPVSKIIYIVILEENKNSIADIVEKYKDKIKVVDIPCYDGTVSSINKVGKMITSDNIIVTKGDLVTNIHIENVAEEYLASETYFLSIIAETTNENVTLGVQGSDLLFYTASPIHELPEDFFSGGHVTLSREFDTVQFYMFKKETLMMFNEETFGFKHNLLPKIVENFRKIKPVRLYSNPNGIIYQVKNKENYLNINWQLKRRFQKDNNAIFDKAKQKEVKQYIKKNQLQDFSNYLGDVKVKDQVIVINSIIGDNSEVGSHSKIFSSIIMDNVQIGEGCIIDKCIVGANVIIKPGSTLMDCVVSPCYLFEEPIQVDNVVFSSNK